MLQGFSFRKQFTKCGSNFFNVDTETCLNFRFEIIKKEKEVFEAALKEAKQAKAKFEHISTTFVENIEKAIKKSRRIDMVVVEKFKY